MANTPPLPLIIESYGLEGPFLLSPMASHWRIDLDHHPAYLLKRFSNNASHTDAVWRRLNYLDEQGLTPSPLWRSQINGAPALEWRGGYWILIPWLNGSPAPVFSDWGFPKLLRLLSFVHQFGRGCQEGEVFNPARIYSQRLIEMEDEFNGRPSKFDQGYQRFLTNTLPNTHRACDLLNEVNPTLSSDWTICHGDPSGRNTFHLGDGRWAFVDWDRAVLAPRWWELSQALRRYNERNGWRKRSLWKNLNRDIRPSLSRQEQLALWACLLFPQSLWRLGAQYYHEKLNRPDRWFSERFEAIQRMEIHRLLALQDWGRSLEVWE